MGHHALTLNILYLRYPRAVLLDDSIGWLETLRPRNSLRAVTICGGTLRATTLNKADGFLGLGGRRSVDLPVPSPEQGAAVNFPESQVLLPALLRTCARSSFSARS